MFYYEQLSDNPEETHSVEETRLGMSELIRSAT